MQDLLPSFERELAFLRDHAGEFAQRYPKIAGQLLLTGDAGDDPHVERLIQSFALLSARIHKRLDDDFPLITESLLEVLYPHYLRPFPSCSIACFNVVEDTKEALKPARIKRGTSLGTQPVRGISCTFRTAYDVDVLPMRVTAVDFRGAVAPPSGTIVPKGATTTVSVRLELMSGQASWASLGVQSLRLYLDGKASQITALREALCGRVVGCLVQLSPMGPWASGGNALPMSVGFADDESLIDLDARSHAAYRLLTEYFVFPEKFNFIDLPLPRSMLESDTRTVTLHYLMSGLRADSDDAQMLETLSDKNLVLGCTPVVNLFAQKADPIRLTQTSNCYSVLADGRQAFAFEVHSIDKVYRLQETPEGEAISEFRPFYSLRHEQLLREGESGGRYWAVHRDEALARQSPGHELMLSIVDVDFDPAALQTDTLSIDVTATNRDLPSLLSIGNGDGDLVIEGGNSRNGIHLLRRPTQSHRFASDRGTHWRLISHLSVNHLTLTGGGVDALKEMLRLYDLPRSATARRQLDAIVSIDFRPANACMPGKPYTVFVRGTEIRMGIDEQGFVGIGLRLFAQVLDHFFGLCAHANSFTQLKLLSARTQEELIACPRRSGQHPLV